MLVNQRKSGCQLVECGFILFFFEPRRLGSPKTEMVPPEDSDMPNQISWRSRSEIFSRRRISLADLPDTSTSAGRGLVL